MEIFTKLLAIAAGIGLFMWALPPRDPRAAQQEPQMLVWICPTWGLYKPIQPSTSSQSPMDRGR